MILTLEKKEKIHLKAFCFFKLCWNLLHKIILLINKRTELLVKELSLGMTSWPSDCEDILIMIFQTLFGFLSHKGYNLELNFYYANSQGGKGNISPYNHVLQKLVLLYLAQPNEGGLHAKDKISVRAWESNSPHPQFKWMPKQVSPSIMSSTVIFLLPR